MKLCNDLISEVYDELCERGYDVCSLEMLQSIAYQNDFQTTIQFWIDDEDEDSWNGAKISSNRIEMDNDLSLGQKLLICNLFNKQSNYCSAYLSDDDNELFMVSACVSINCENFVEMCADMFEEVIFGTEFLIDMITED